MNKSIIGKIIVFILIIICILFLAYYFYKNDANDISCNANLSITTSGNNKEYIKGAFNYEFINGKGLALVNVVVRNDKGNKTENNVSFTFSYIKNGSLYVISDIDYTAKINGTASQELTNPYLALILKNYIVDIKGNLAFKIVELKDHGWLFYSNKLPLMVCS